MAKLDVSSIGHSGDTLHLEIGVDMNKFPSAFKTSEQDRWPYSCCANSSTTSDSVWRQRHEKLTTALQLQGDDVTTNPDGVKICRLKKP
ncbi:hypothetical protein Tco_0415041 [Tanacetum coccineum]